jgi:hypothetical protein
MYETRPSRLSAYASLDREELLDETKEFKDIIDNNILFNHWTTFIAKNLRSVGRWSWITINKSGLLSRDEEYNFYQKWKGDRDKKSLQEKAV